MTEPTPEGLSEGAAEAQKPEKQPEGPDSRPSPEEAAAIKKRIKARREEVFEEAGHIRGYSDKFGLSNLALVFFTDEDDEEGEATTQTATGVDEVASTIEAKTGEAPDRSAATAVQAESAPTEEARKQESS